MVGLPVLHPFGQDGQNIEALVKVMHLPEGSLARPGLSDRTSPAGLNQADRDTERLIEVFPEEIGRGGEGGDGLGRAHIPPAGRYGGAFQRHVARGLCQPEQPDAGDLVQGGQFLLEAVDTDFSIPGPGRTHGHLHIGLPAAHPHFSDQDIVQRYGFPVRERDAVRTTRVRGRELDKPLAVSGNGSAVGLGGPGRPDRHRGLRVGLAPDTDRGVALKNHVVAEDGFENHLG